MPVGRRAVGRGRQCSGTRATPRNWRRFSRHRYTTGRGAKLAGRGRATPPCRAVARCGPGRATARRAPL